MSNNIKKLCDITIDMAEGMNMVLENYNALISIEKKVINLQKDIDDIRSKSYISQNINKVGLDMPSHLRKTQV